MNSVRSVQCEPSPLVTACHAPSAGNTGSRVADLPTPLIRGACRQSCSLSLKNRWPPSQGLTHSRPDLSRWGGFGARPPSGLPTAAGNTATVGRPPVAVAPYAFTRSSRRRDTLGCGGWSVVIARYGREYRPPAHSPALATRQRGRDTSPAAACPTLRVFPLADHGLRSGTHGGAVSGRITSAYRRKVFRCSAPPRRSRIDRASVGNTAAVTLAARSGRAHRRSQPSERRALFPVGARRSSRAVARRGG